MDQETESVKDAIADIPNGIKLNIKIDGIAIPITSVYVGQLKDNYFLIHQPSPYATIKPKLFVGNKLVIQYLHEGTIYVFLAKIIEVITKPIQIVVLEYPEKVVNLGLRSAERVTCRVPAAIIFKGAPKEAVIEDLSITGCRINATYKPVEKNYIARPNEKVQINCRFPGAFGENIIAGIVRNAKKKELKLTYGIQFETVSPEARKAIERYLETIK